MKKNIKNAVLLSLFIAAIATLILAAVQHVLGIEFLFYFVLALAGISFITQK